MIRLLVSALVLGACATSQLRDEVEDAALPATIVALADGVPGTSERRASAPSVVDPGPRETATRAAGPTAAELRFVFDALDAERFDRAARDDFVVPATVTEAEALTIFLARNTQLRAAWRASLGARHRYGQMRALTDLVRQYDAFSKRPDRPRPTPTPPTPDALRSRVVDADVSLAREQFRATALQLASELVTAFHEARYQSKSAAIIGEGRALAKRLVGVARARLAAGPGSTADVLRAEMRLERLRRQAKTARERRDAARRRLAALLDANAETKPGRSRALGSRPDLESVRARVLATSPAVRRADLMWRRAEAMLALAEARLQPGWTLGTAEGGDPSAAGARGRRFRPSDVTAGHYLEELRDRVASAARSRLQARTLVPAAAQNAHAELGDALRRVHLYRSELQPRAKQALKAVEAAYRVGRASFLELDDAQRLWLDTALGRHKARRDAAIASAALHRHVGGNPRSGGNP